MKELWESIMNESSKQAGKTAKDFIKLNSTIL